METNNIEYNIERLKKIDENMKKYERTIFNFDRESENFIPANTANIKPKENGWYVTIRCGFSGIYIVLNEWKDGEWMMNCADGSTTIAFLREKIDISKILE